MKEQYEMRTRTWLPRRTYTIIRLDGKAFHTFTKGMDTPYDEKFMNAMTHTAMHLGIEIQGCDFGYTQSDEISLLLTDFDKITTDAWFDGQVQKMVSVAASMASSYFNAYINHDLERFEHKMAFFDARIFTIPDPVEVENYFVWRQKDAMRNSISMHAQSLYSHKELNSKSQSDMHDMIHTKGENWNDLPDGFKRGRSVFKNIRGEWTNATPDFQELNLDGRYISSIVPKINYDEEKEI